MDQGSMFCTLPRLASVNVGCQGKSGPGKIHEVILEWKITQFTIEGGGFNGTDPFSGFSFC